jgi:hypothetical protein
MELIKFAAGLQYSPENIEKLITNIRQNNATIETEVNALIADNTTNKSDILLLNTFSVKILPVTLAALELLIMESELVLGSQYFVTDKDWLLYATSAYTLKPVSGSLHIFNGQTLPDGIEPDILLIDTGIVDWDISSTGNPLVIDIINDYEFTDASIDVIATDDSINLHVFGILPIDAFGEDLVAAAKIRRIIKNTPFFTGPMYDSIMTNSYTLGDSFRVIFEFHRSELSYPIPIPQLLSAVLDEVGSGISVSYNHSMVGQIINSEVSGFQIYRNGIAEPDGSWYIDNSTIGVENGTNFYFGDIITFSHTSNIIKNIWGGLLPEIIDFPVTNNVPGLMSAETNTDGTKIILTFNRPMGNVDTPANLVFTDADDNVLSFDDVNLGASPNDTIEVNFTTTPLTSDLVIKLNMIAEGIDTAEGTLYPVAIEDFEVVNNSTVEPV